MKKNLLFLCIGLVAGAIATAVAIRLSTRTDTVFWSKEDLVVVLDSGVHIDTDADTQSVRREFVIPKGASFNDEGVGHPSFMRFLKLSLAIPVGDVDDLFHRGRTRGGDLLTDMMMIYEPRRSGRAEIGTVSHPDRQRAPTTAYLGRMDSTVAKRLAAPLSGWLSRVAEGRAGLALSGFSLVSGEN